MVRLSLLIFLVAAVVSHAEAQAVSQPVLEAPVITVTGTAQVTVPPDAATLSIIIENVSPSPSEAASKTSEITSAVRSAMEKIGITGSAVRQTGYWVRPNWVYPDSGKTLDGYMARLSIAVETRDLSEIGRIVEAAVGTGATTIGNIDYTSSVLPKARREALTRAIEQARLDAAAMAEAAGGELGVLQYLSTEDGRSGLVVRGERSPLEMATPVNLNVKATVRGQWTLIFRR